MPASWAPFASLVGWRSLVNQKEASVDAECPILHQYLDKNALSKQATSTSLTKSPKKDKMDLSTLVCHMSENPFKILKMASKGSIQVVENILSRDPMKLFITDNKGWNVLHHAASSNCELMIYSLLDHGADLNQTDNNGQTPLHTASIRGHANAVKALIKSGIDCNVLDNSSKAALHLATEHNHAGVLEILSTNQEQVNMYIKDENGRTALHISAINDYEEAARILLANYKKCPNQPCNNGFYPIHMAAKCASVKVLNELLMWAEAKGCERSKMIRTPDVDGNVPLHLAVHGGDIKAVEICLQNEANISWQQHDKSTPVHLACSQGAVDIVKLMFDQQPEEKGKVLTITDAQGMTPLHCAAMFDHSELITYLLEQGSSVNNVDAEHRTPLLLAASQKCWRSVEVLLNNGADPAIRDSSNKNILHVVIINGGGIADILRGQTSIMPHLRQLMNEQDEKGCSPMHYASKSGHTRSLASLIQLGASVRIKNEKNESPLHFAARYGRYNTVSQLLDSINGFLIMNESNGFGRTGLHISSREGHTRVVKLLLSKGALLHRDYAGKTPLHLAAIGGHTETITLLLSVWAHLLDQVDKDGNTPLHLAVRSNKPDVVTQLLSLNAKIILNNDNFKPVDIALYYKLHEAAIALVTHERGPKEIMQASSNIHACVSLALIKTLPKVYEAALTQSIVRSSVKEDSKEYSVKYSFYPLQMSKELIASHSAKRNDPHYAPIPLYACCEMVYCGRVDLLMHPLTQKYLEMKWHSYGFHIHLLNLFLYFIFLLLVTTFASNIIQTIPKTSFTGNGSSVIMEDSNITSTWNSQNISNIPLHMKYRPGLDCILSAIGILCYAVFGILRELFQMYHLKLRYISDGINLVEWILYITSILMILPIFIGCDELKFDYSSAAIAVFTAWFTLLLYFQRFDRIGIYVVMFLEILNTLLKVVAVFSVLIVAFSLSFYILMSNGNNLSYQSVPIAMIKTVAMMLGEIDFMNSFVYPYFNLSMRADMNLPHAKTSFGILVVFMILMPILLMNLLIGLAVGDIESVKKNAQLKLIAMQVELHRGLEEKIPSWILDKVNKDEIIVYPNEAVCRKNFLQKILYMINCCTPFCDQPKSERFESLEGTLNEDLLLEELESQQRRFREIQGQLDQQTKLLRLIMQKMEIQSEADETDEGVCLEDLMRPHHRRWTSATGSKKTLALQNSEADSY